MTDPFILAVRRAKQVGDTSLDDIPEPMIPERDPTICPDHLLDRTQPSDLGYTTPEAARERWYRENPGKEPPSAYNFRTIDPHPTGLSWTMALGIDVLGWRALADVYHGGLATDAMVYPEIAQTGAYRCRNIDMRGARCLHYTTHGFLCTVHAPYWTRHKKAAMAHGYHIENTTLADLVAKHQNDPKLRDLAPEIGLLRALLEVAINKVAQGDRLEDMDDATRAQLIHTARIIGEQIERLVSIETKMNQRLSLEQLAEIAMRMFEAVIEIMQPTPEQATRLGNAFGKLATPTRTIATRLEEPAVVENPVLATSPLDAHIDGKIERQVFTAENRVRTAGSPLVGSGTAGELQRRNDLLDAARKWAPTTIPRFTP